jgi:hypothetical protein
LVAPSRFENFGTVAAEALAMGRPVIYTQNTGLAETVADAGLAVPQDDPERLASEMTRLWKDPALRHLLAQRGAARLQPGGALSFSAAVDRRVDFYRRLIAQTPRTLNDKCTRLDALGPSSLLALLHFASDLTGTLAGVASGRPVSPGTRAARILERHRQSGRALSSIWLYGAGQHTRRLLVERAVLEATGSQICGIIDDAAGSGDCLFDLPVLSRTIVEAQLREKKLHVDAVLLSSDTIEETLWNNAECFRRQNVPVLRLYS